MPEVQPTNNPVPSDHPADARDNFKRIDEVVNLQSNQSSPTRTGKRLDTLYGLEQRYLQAIQQTGGVPLNGGVWAAGQTFTSYNQFMIFNDIPYRPLTSTTLPYGPTGASPDPSLVGPYSSLSLQVAAEVFSNQNLINNPAFESPGSTANPPDTTPRDYLAGEELFAGFFAVGNLTGVTYTSGNANGTGQLYIDVTKSQKQQDSTQSVTASIANADGIPDSSLASVVDNGSYWRVTFDLSNTFSVKLEFGEIATAHELPKQRVEIRNLDQIKTIAPPPVGDEVRYYKDDTHNANSLWRVVLTSSVTPDDSCVITSTSDPLISYVVVPVLGFITSRMIGLPISDEVLQPQKIEAAWKYCAQRNIVFTHDPDTLVCDYWRPGAFNEILSVPSNLTAHFSKGAVIKRSDYTETEYTFNRLIDFRNATTNVRITGVVELDGSYDPLNAPSWYNEQNHCLLIFGSQDVYIEEVISSNAMGDCVGISGRGSEPGQPIEFSDNVRIDRITATKAGRKCLVIEASRSTKIESAILDNREGSVDGLGGNTLDFEPFTVIADDEQLSAKIGYLYTRGTGDDFTAATTRDIVSKFDLFIDTWIMEITDRPVPQPAIIAYGVSIKVNTLSIDCRDATNNSIIAISYANLLRAENLTIKCGTVTDRILSIEAVTDRRPEVYFGSVVIEGANGRPLYISSAKVDIESISIYGDDTKTQALSSIISLSNAMLDVTIGNWYSENIGTPSAAVCQISQSGAGIGFVERVRIPSVVIKDDRATPSSQVFHPVDSASSPYVTLPSISSPYRALIASAGTWWLEAGGVGSPMQIRSGQSPLNSISANPGSTCRVESGQFWVKDSATDATGWRML